MKKAPWLLLLSIFLIAAMTGLSFAKDIPQLTAEQKMEMSQIGPKIYGTPSYMAGSGRTVSELDEVFLFEDFEDGFPEDWEIVDYASDTWTWIRTQDGNDGWAAPFEDGANWFMYVSSDDPGTGIDMDEQIITSSFSTAGYGTIELSFDFIFNWLVAPDSFYIDYSINGGTDWENAVYWLADVSAFPQTVDLSAFISDQADVKLRFGYYNGGGYNWGAGIDNVMVWDTVGDLTPPAVTYVSAPSYVYSGESAEVVVTAIDETELSTVTLTYGHFDTGTSTVSDLTDVVMTATANPDEFSAVIPAEFNVPEYVTVWAATATDASDNATRLPAVATNWYGISVYPSELSEITWAEDSYRWLEVVGAPGAVEMAGSDDGITPYILFADMGWQETFNWYGIDFTGLKVSYNGFITFDPNGTDTWQNFGVPATTTPNGVIQLVQDDLRSNHTGSGHIWYGVVDDCFVVTYDNVHNYGSPAYSSLNAQIVLTPNGEVYLNYETIDVSALPYTGDHGIGYEDLYGNLGAQIYRGTEWTWPTDQSTLRISYPGGVVSGTITNSNGGGALEGVEIQVWDMDRTEVIYSTVTDVNGDYTFSYITAGTYDIRAYFAGFEEELLDDYVIAAGEEYTIDFALTEVDEESTLEGTIYSLETEGAVVANATVRLYGGTVNRTTTTDGNGYFTFGAELFATSLYNLSVNADHFVYGYHDDVFQVQLGVGTTDVDIYLNEVLPPTNVQSFYGDESVSLTWDPPANHEVVAELTRRAGDLRAMVERTLESGDAASIAKLRPYQDELASLEYRLSNLSTDELDEIADFIGYRVKYGSSLMEDVILPTVFTTQSAIVTGLENSTLYFFYVAADYGYEDDNLLVWSEVVDERPLPAPEYTWDTEEYWFDDINPANGGSGTPLGLTDDSNSGFIAFPEGMNFTFYGTSYNQFAICSNGWFSFLHNETDLSGTIPSTTTPNALIAPFWRDLDPGDSDEEDVFYWFDEENNLAYVQYYTGNFNGPQNNTKLFQAVLDLNDNSIYLNYDNCAGTWETTATIGIENADGTAGTVIPGTEIADETTFHIYWLEANWGNLGGEGDGSYVLTDIAGDLVGVPNARVAVTDANGRTVSGNTQEDGEFMVRLIDRDAGPWDVSITCIGYVDYEEQIAADAWGEEFTLNRNFEILPIPTNTPPIILAYDSNYDKGVMLTLARPGGGGEYEYLQWDDGIVGDAGAWNLGTNYNEFWFGGELGVDGFNVMLTSAAIRFTTTTDFTPPYPDATHSEVIIGIFDWVDGAPGDLLWTSEPILPTDEEPMPFVFPNIMLPNSHFLVGFQSTDEAFANSDREGITMDSSNDLGNIWYFDSGGAWVNWGIGDAIVRAEVLYNPAGTDEVVSRTIGSGDITINVPKASAGNLDHAATHVRYLGQSSRARVASRPTGYLPTTNELDEFLGFFVEYSWNGTDWTQDNDESFADMNYFIELGTATENTDLWVRARAEVTDPANGNVVLSDYTEAVQIENADPALTGYTNPPMAPSNFVGEVSDLTVTFSWTPPTLCEDGTELLDLAGYELWMVDEGGNATSIGTTTATTFEYDVDVIGAYLFAITAYDDVPVQSMPAICNGGPFIVGNAFIGTGFEPDDTPPMTITAGAWEIGVPTGELNVAFERDQVLGTHLAGDYENSENSIVYFDQLVQFEAGAFAAFNAWYDYESNWDGFRVVISSDGTNWEAVEPVGGYPGTWEGQVPAFTGNSGGWQFVIVDFSAYEGRAVYIGFEHHTDGSVNTGLFGCAIDPFGLYNAVEPTYGSFDGTVQDADGNPVEGCSVTLDGTMYATTTNASGFYEFPQVVVTIYDFVFDHPAFWPIRINDVQAIAEQTVTVDVTPANGNPLTGPAGELDPSTLEMTVYIGGWSPDDSVTTGQVTLSSTGSGPLEWHGRIALLTPMDGMSGSGLRPSEIFRNRPQINTVPSFASDAAPSRGPVETNYGTTDETDDLWEPIAGWDTEDTQGGVGAVVTSDMVYTCEWGYNGLYGFFRYDLEGNLVSTETFPTPMQGIRDLAWDGTYLYGANQNTGGNVFKFNPDDLNDRTQLGVATGQGRGIALDPETGDIYASNWSTLGALRMLAPGVYTYEDITLPAGLANASIYGIAWMPADPDEMNLWAFCQPASNAVVYRANLATGEVDAGHEVYTSDQGIAGGIDIWNSYDPAMWTIATNLQGTPNHIDLWEGHEAGFWLYISDPDSAWGILEPDGEQTITITADIRGTDLEVVHGQVAEAELQLFGPRWEDGAVTIITITFINATPEDVASMPSKYDLHQNYPNPFNPATQIKFDLVDAQNVKLSVFNILGQEVARLVDAPMEAGFHQVTFDASKLASGIYFYRVETEAFTAMKKMVLVK